MKSGTGILNTRNTRATKNPSKGGGRSFFQLNPFFVLFFSGLSFSISITPKAHVETVLVIYYTRK